ncbi:phage baseplate upper protein [Bacillus inaquosorum]|uniref:phage baseplate upper protein n=1 Tax=Bacillus inaquosorum TaxID=483913 RepID=UPI00227FF797|nr:phage baseplate upper protein [Bacillus inaquosorum]MCY8083280.1 phage baseplate upper protein [Bacillus inaquosorum]MCY8701993.1 phage baseplate upper protein [Bacillus inaquosorum]
MIYKDANVTYDINSRRSDGRSTNIQFMTQDTGSAKLSFSFTKNGAPLPLSAVDAKIVLLYPDGSFYKKSLTLIDKVNGKAEYILSDEELKHYGIVKAELKLYYTNGQALATSFFTFTISKTLEDQNIVPVAEYYIDDFETLRDGINQTVDEISQTIEELREKFADLEAIETKEGAQIKADAALSAAKFYTDTHISDTANPHKVTKGQVGLDKVLNVEQASKTNFDNHASDKTIHVTEDDRNKWTTAEANAKAYTDVHAADMVKHITAAERTKWNSAQLFKITNDAGGVLISIGDTDDFLSEIVEVGKQFGTFYSSGKSTNGPSSLSTRGFFHFTSTDSDGKGTFGYVVAIDYKNNVFTNYLNLNQGWTGWSKLETERNARSYTDNLEKKLTDLTWFSPTLQNSWVNYTDSNATDQTKYKVRYAKDVTGTVFVEGAISKGIIGFGVPAFILPEGYRPARAIQWVGVASQGGMSGIPQTHRLLVDIDGKVVIENCSNTVKPNDYISLGFSFKAV